jgi:hypothetical protein
MSVDLQVIADQPLSPARQALFNAISTLRSAQAEVERASGPTDHLRSLIAEAEQAERHLAERRGPEVIALAAWLEAGGVDEDERPLPSCETLSAEREVAHLSRDAEAARIALREAEAVVARTVVVMSAAARTHATAVIDAAVEEAQRLIREEYIPALIATLRIEARLAGLKNALFEMANRARDPVPAASTAAGRIGELLAAAKKKPAVPCNEAAGRALLERLATEPSAVLGDYTVQAPL